jgi:hypothetical protein
MTRDHLISCLCDLLLASPMVALIVAAVWW